MNSTETENKIENEKIDKRRIKRAPWRTTVDENGNVKYNDKPLDPDYHNKYYHQKRKNILSSKVQCDLCGSYICKAQLTRHKKTALKCVRIQKEKIMQLLD